MSMYQGIAIKQVEEKNVANEINNMVWSDHTDLIAFSNVKGDVALHRLTWTKAWSLDSPNEGQTVKGITWRPDGKILAIAYSSGDVLLVSVENKASLVNVQGTKGDITCISWVQERIESKSKDSKSEDDKPNNYMKYIDLSKVYLSEPPLNATLDSAANTEEPAKTSFLHTQSELNLLLVGTKEGFVHIRIFGCFTCAILNINEYLGSTCSVENVHLSEDLSKIFVTVKDFENNIKLVIIDSTVFKTHAKELFAIALKHIRLMDLVLYLSNTITSITETWESILLEIDNKLSKYASKVAEGGVTADFLDLLMFGVCSNEMEEFLIHDLTKKGLEKFGQTIEMSYANIQQLLLKNVTKYGQNVTYHLAELRGMARFEYRYKIFGLSEDLITDAISSNGAFLIKAGEMLQIINHSVINYKAFFRWLYTAIMHLMDEPIPSDVHKMTQQDLAYITEFLQNFDNIGNKNDTTKQNKFTMERLGQYLVDSPLTTRPDMEGNEWMQFLLQSECVQKSVLKHFSELSLIQQYNHLKSSIDAIFQAPKDVIITQFKSLQNLRCFNFGPTALRMSSVNLSKEMVLFAFIQPTDGLYLLQTHVAGGTCLGRSGLFYFAQFLSHEHESDGDKYQILDVKFYSNNILSILLQESTSQKTGVILQFNLPGALEKLDAIDVRNELSNENIPILNGSNLLPKLFKTVDGMPVSQFAVSGRKVGIVLSENRRKVRLFEMEGEEEDEEDAEMSSIMIRENDVTMEDSGAVDLE